MTYPTTLSVFHGDVFTDAEQRTLAGFLGNYSGLTRDDYSLHVRQFAQWCHDRRVGLFDVARGDIEAFARNLEAIGRARAMMSRRLSLDSVSSSRCPPGPTIGPRAVELELVAVSGGLSDETLVDGVADPPFQRSHRFFAGLPSACSSA
ncbi:MAG: hypothetical protein ABIR32_17175 [Ilumatobacteraceae bacterium]